MKEKQRMAQHCVVLQFIITIKPKFLIIGSPIPHEIKWQAQPSLKFYGWSFAKEDNLSLKKVLRDLRFQPISSICALC
uniref:Uncharacterized protein n=1 Tax=Rhizophora mucronata TaxID=61149 RepID=A0A2P2PPM8_RHIMU